MIFLVLPVKETPEKDFNKICMALRRDGESALATFLCQKVQWGNVTPENPYMEILMEGTVGHYPKTTKSAIAPNARPNSAM